MIREMQTKITAKHFFFNFQTGEDENVLYDIVLTKV